MFRLPLLLRKVLLSPILEMQYCQYVSESPSDWKFGVEPLHEKLEFPRFTIPAAESFL